MDDYGLEGAKIRAKVAYAVNHAQELKQEDLEETWAEAMRFVGTLPREKQGAFYWKSGLECLFMMVSASGKQI